MDETDIQETPTSEELGTESVEQSQEILDTIDQLLTRYEVLAGDPSDVLFTYIVILLACIVIFPLSRMVVNSISKGFSRWK